MSDLWQTNSQTWNVDFVANIFDDQAMHTITEVPVVHNNRNDILRWIPAKDGKCSTRNIYRHISKQQIVQLPQQGSRSINHHANNILKRAWKSKELPPLIKAFTWRLIRRALATAKRALGIPVTLINIMQLVEWWRMTLIYFPLSSTESCLIFI
jgi:hypothetical protein